MTRRANASKKAGQILPKTAIGAGTCKILQFNTIDRILERLALIDAGFYQ